MRNNNLKKLIALALFTAILIALYFLFKLSFSNIRLLKFQLESRTTKVLAIVISGFAIGASSITFQTVINNKVVTPCLLGMNSLYTLINTMVVFILGTGSVFFLNKNLSFGLNLILMVLVAYFVYGIMFKKTNYNVLYILLIGTVLSSLFGSLQSSLIRVMDPNEYDTLLSSLTASFDNINSEIIIVSIILLIGVALMFMNDLRNINVISLGRNQSINLGVDYDRSVKRLLVGVTLYIAIATAMVGPISFLGLITANITRAVFKTYKHKYLITATILNSIIALLLGQIIVERVSKYSVPISVYITLFGGIYFLGIIIKNRKAGI